MDRFPPGRPATLAAYVVALAAISLALLWIAATSVPLRVGFNTNEGWNALHAWTVQRGVSLYAFDGYANFPNYPPLGFLILAGLGSVFGDAIVVGRMLALASLLVVTCCVFLVARRVDRSTLASGMAAVTFLVLALSTGRTYVAINDPQYLAHALQLAGLVALVGHAPAELRAPRLLAACALMLLGGLIKHNLIALPVAVSLWLLLANRRAAAVWFLAAASGLFAAAMASGLVYGGAMFEQVLGHHRIYSLDRLLGRLRWAAPVLPFAVAGWVSLPRREFARPAGLLGLYGVCALAFGTIFVGGQGVSINAFFDFLIAAAMLFAFYADRWLASPISAMERWGVVVVVVLTLTWQLMESDGYYRHLAGAAALAPETAAVVTILENSDGPVACEDLSLCYWAKKDSAIDFSNTGQILSANPEVATILLDYLNSRGVDAAVLDNERPGAMSSALADLLRQQFSMTQQGRFVAFVRQSGTPGQ